MKRDDLPKFFTALRETMQLYGGAELSDFAYQAWAVAVQGYELQAVINALMAHATDPERGQYAPRPADIVRLLRGTVDDESRLVFARLLSGDHRELDRASAEALRAIGGTSAIRLGRVADNAFLERRFVELRRAFANRQRAQALLEHDGRLRLL